MLLDLAEALDVGRLRRDPEWRSRAACLEVPLDWFFPPLGAGPNPYGQARTVCDRCAVRAECLNLALELDIRDGMFGGLTPREREQVVLEQGRPF